MSRPCDGIKLAPVKGSELMNAAAAAPAPAPTSRYVPPARRSPQDVKAEPLKAIDARSEADFPTLGAAPPAKKAWGAKPSVNMKEVVNLAIEKQAAGIVAKEETDPFKMTEEQLEAEGWVRLPFHREAVEEPLPETPQKQEDHSSWTTFGIPREVMEDPDKMMKFVQCVYADGTPIERKKVAEPIIQPMFFNLSSLERAQKKMRMFIQGKVVPS